MIQLKVGQTYISKLDNSLGSAVQILSIDYSQTLRDKIIRIHYIDNEGRRCFSNRFQFDLEMILEESFELEAE